VRALDYMILKKHDGIAYSRNIEDLEGFDVNTIYAYSDASFADDKPSRRSTIGYIIFMNGGPIAWKSKLSPTVVTSSGHTELAALNMCAEDVVQIRVMLDKLGFPQKEPTPIYCDSEAAIAIANNKRSTHNKGIDVKYEQIREWIRKRDIITVPCSTHDQRADIMTKPLGATKFAINAAEIVVDSRDFR
jgi:hypothetical protein